MNTNISGLLAAVTFTSVSMATTLPPAYWNTPTSTSGAGNSARRDSGGFFRNPNLGYEHLIYWLGTNLTPGLLIMDFNTPFTDGSGFDFAIVTDSEGWGPLATSVSLSFFLGSTLVGSIASASISPGATFEYELPGAGLIVNRVILTNITAGPPEISTLADMAFTNAGAAYAPAVPDSTIGFEALSVLGLISIAVMRRRTWR